MPALDGQDDDHESNFATLIQDFAFRADPGNADRVRILQEATKRFQVQCNDPVSALYRSVRHLHSKIFENVVSGRAERYSAGLGQTLQRHEQEADLRTCRKTCEERDRWSDSETGNALSINLERRT